MSTAQRFLRDDEGAVMVIGVFMAVLVTGFLYYIIGIGNTVIYRERMQDAADAMAFAGAVIHARGMNLIALINIVMAMLTTIFFALRMVMAALYLLAAFVAITAPPASVPIFQLGDRVRQIGTQYRDSILKPALRLGHGAQQAIRQTYPYLAQANAVAISRSQMYSPPVTIGAIHPLLDHPLPVKPAPMRRLCEKAVEPITQVIGIPLQWLGGIGSRVAGFVGRVVAMVFCNELNDDRMRPHEIDPGDGSCNDGLPGQNCEYSQIRSVVMGNTPFQGNEQGVAVANWGRGAGGSVFGALGNFARFGFAQAEYYYEGDARDGRANAREEWMWHMWWRARFRRFRVPSNPLGLSSVTGGIDLSLIDRVIVH